jgi:hypothetical protein
MAQLALGAAGAWIGSLFGMPMIGWAIGSTIGGILFGPKQEGPRLSDLKVQGSQYGGMIPVLFGYFRVAGMIRWSTDLKEHAHKSSGKGGGPTNYTYSCSFAIRLNDTEATGPILGIRKIWADKRLIYDTTQTTNALAQLPITIYLGTEDQLPDPTIESVLGVGNVPAYRGTAYVVFTDLDLTDYFNRIPQFEFEVHATGTPPALSLYAQWPVAYSVPLDGLPWSYPFNLNGIALSGETLTTNRYRSAQDYGGGAGGVITFDRSTWTLRGDHLSTDATVTLTLGGAFWGVHGSMNSGIAYAAGQVYVDCTGYGGAINTTVDTFAWLLNGAVTYTPDLQTMCLNAGGGFADLGLNISGTIWTQNGYLYATGGGGFSTTGEWLRRWSIDVGTGGVLSGDFDQSFDLSPYTHGPGYSADPIMSDDGYIYILVESSDTSPTYGLGTKLVKLDTALNFIKHWLPAVMPTGVTPGYSSFVIYQNNLIAYKVVGSVPEAVMWSLNADGTLTQVSSVNMPTFTDFNPPHSQIPGGNQIIYLGNGYAATPAGILTLGGGYPTRGSIVQTISELCGLQDSQIDVSQLTDLVFGYGIQSQGAGRSSVEPLMILAPPFDAVESDAKIKFPLRSGKAVATIPDSDLGAHPTNSQPVPLISHVRAPDVNIPQRMNIQYLNVDADYQINSQIAQRMTTSSQVHSSVDLPIVMEDARGRATVTGQLYNAWLERDHFTFMTPRDWAYLDPTDVVVVHGETLRILQRDESVNGVIKWEGVPTRADIFIQAPVPAPATTYIPGNGPAGFVPPVLPAVPVATMMLLDIPLLSDSDYPNGFYAAIRGSTGGAYIYKSTDGGTSYNQDAQDTAQQVFGTATSALGDWSGGNVYDESNTVTVTIGATGDTLESVTSDAVLNGANVFLLGSEIVQARTATLTGTNTYRLSGLLRGRLGTEWATGSHVADEPFVALTTPTPVFNEQGLTSELGMPRYYKAVPRGGSLAQATAVPFTNTGVALNPYSPIELGGGTDGSGNVTLNWTRRTRFNGIWRDFVEVPLNETTETYIVQIWDSSYTLCARIITATSPTTVYTSAQQVSDFGQQQQTVYFTVGQLGSVSLGSQSKGTAPGAGASNTNPTTPIAPYAFPTAIAPVPSPTRPINYTFSIPDSLHLSPWVTGQTFVGKFTTSASSPQLGSIAASEYGSLPTYRRIWIATDTGGINRVGSIQGGTTATLTITPSGGVTLSPTTVYYLLMDFQLPNGSLSSPAGTNAASIINLQLN